MHNDKSEEARIAGVTPVAQYQVVTVTFPATPGLDKIVRHKLNVENPNDIYVTVLRQSVAGSVYEDKTATRKPWQQGYIVLRSDAANWQGTLMLSVLRDRVTEGQ